MAESFSVQRLWLSALVLCLVPLTAARAGEPEAPLALAEAGQALLPIVVSDQASDVVRASATELAQYLQKITGASFNVTTGDGSTGIRVGTLAQFPDTELADPLAVREGFDGKGAYVIRTEPARL